MFDYLCYEPGDSYLPKRRPSSFIRILDAAPCSKRFDIYLSGLMISKNLTRKKYTPYLAVPPGPHEIKALAPNTMISKNLLLEVNFIYTVCITGCGELEFLLVYDMKPALQRGKANIRMANLVPDIGGVDASVSGHALMFTNIGYRYVTEYTPSEEGKCRINICRTGTGGSIHCLPDVTLKPEWDYTLYLMPGIKENLRVNSILLLDGGTYLNPK